MRVGILGSRGFPNIQGGVEKHCEHLSMELVKLGCDVFAFARKPYMTAPLQEYNGVHLVVLPAIRQKYLETIIHTFLGVWVARWLNLDVLHFQAVGSALWVPLARLLGLKVVFTSHGSNYRHLKWGLLARFILRLSERAGVLFSNEVITITNFIAAEIKANYNRSAAVIPNGVKIPAKVSSTNALKKYNLQPHKYILAVGRLDPVKDFLTLIEAFVQTKPANHKLVIVGDADQESDYKNKIIQAAEQHSDITLTGFLQGEPLQELFSHAALFVLPSFYEGLPIALLEALAYGLPCLATNIPGNQEAELAPDRYFEPGNRQELAEKLSLFLPRGLDTIQEEEQRSMMLAKKFNWPTVAKQTLEVYKRVCIPKPH